MKKKQKKLDNITITPKTMSIIVYPDNLITKLLRPFLKVVVQIWNDDGSSLRLEQYRRRLIK